MRLEHFRDFAHHLLGAQQTDAIYPREHPRVGAAVRELYLHSAEWLRAGEEIRVALVDSEFVVDDTPVTVDSDLLAGLARLFRRREIGKLTIAPGLRRWEIKELVGALNQSGEELQEVGGLQASLDARGVKKIAAGPLTVRGRSSGTTNSSLDEAWDLYHVGLAAIRRLRSRLERGPDREAVQEASRLAGRMVDAVHRHGEAFLLLQALKKHDEYSYTHSLNVALLSVNMARAMDLPDNALMVIGMAALLHDIGKELVPDEVLNKPGKLTPEEWETMQRHGVDGAKMLMQAPDVDDLAVIVAYEHQLAYETDNPDHGRWPLHFASELICIADVYDALRSRRPYREPMPPEKAMGVMEEDAPEKFDVALFAGFRRMMGHYPPGTLVELSDGSTALSVAASPVLPERPKALVLADGGGDLLEPPLPLDLSLAPDPVPVRSLDADAVGIDPFDYL